MMTQDREPTIQEQLLRSVAQRPLTDEEALLWMLLFHTHAIHLRPGASAADGTAADGTGAGSAGAVPAQTQREVAQLVASLWNDSSDPRSDYRHWYWQYNTRMPYEVLEDVPAELRPRLQELCQTLARDPRVLAVVEED